MANNRDDFEHSEESEYHFSDDEDVSYEAENEPAAKSEEKPAAAKRLNVFTNMSQSRRMLLSAVVFLVLVFIVYKMFVPSSAPPSTDITAAAPAPVQSSTMASAAPGGAGRSAAPLKAEPAKPPVMPQTEQAAPQTPAAMPQTAAVSQPAPAMQAAPSAAPVQSAPMATQQMPPVIPVQPPTGAYEQAPAQPVTGSQPVQAGAAPVPASSQGAVLTAESQQMISQMNAAYQEKLNQYDTENKAMQDQMQALSSRVAMMEGQINQLVQVLTRQAAAQAAAAQPVQPEIKSTAAGYTVQAIIPGRAWLRGANGETVTVTENDMIKDLGRVTKIDPYNGVVEVNTGTKVISLAYGVSE